MENNVSNISDLNCFGCRACELKCPKQSISMQENEEGFIYPKIDDSCINCGLCLKICPSEKVKNNLITLPTSIGFYALILKDKETLSKSASGGAFVGFANKILEDDGVVYGSAFDGGFNVAQIRIVKGEELKLLQGSKYVFSDTLKTFEEVELDLLAEKKVLYSGSPCQIAGLKSFLGKDYEKLITIDLVCHGTPSHKFFKTYFKWLQNEKFSNKIIEYSFRSKCMSGWGSAGYASDGKKILRVDAYQDPYYSSFARNENFKESCYSCFFAQKDRIGDITIGDFWGIEKLLPSIDFKQGVSCCLINTKKGDALFQSCTEKFELYSVDFEQIVVRNGQLNHPSRRPQERNVFYKKIESKGIKSIKINRKIKETLIVFFWKLIPRKLKEFVKKVIKHG